MADPFDSARRKLDRAVRHFADLEREIGLFTRVSPYETVVEPHPDKPNFTVHKLRLTQPLKPIVADITGDVIQNLRSSLDNAAYVVAVASGKTDPKNCAFPFARNLQQMVSSIGRSKDVPKEIQSLFVGFQPYLGGNDLLWSLNEMSNADKHKMVIPIGAGVTRRGAEVRGTGYFSMPNPHVWDREKNEMEILTLGPGAEYKCHFEMHVSVAINGIEFVDGKSVLFVLQDIGVIVERIINTIEFESRRLGYVT